MGIVAGEEDVDECWVERGVGEGGGGGGVGGGGCWCWSEGGAGEEHDVFFRSFGVEMWKGVVTVPDLVLLLLLHEASRRSSLGRQDGFCDMLRLKEECLGFSVPGLGCRTWLVAGCCIV